MTTDRDLDRATRAWLAGGPEELSDRLLDAVATEIHHTRQRHASGWPWRFPTMSVPARASALLVAGALVAVAGVAVLSGGRPSPKPSDRPASAPPASPAALTMPVLDQTFTSPRNGYAVGYPAGWTVKPAIGVWPPGGLNGWESVGQDVVRTTDVRFVGASQRFDLGMTQAQWFEATCELSEAASQCPGMISAWAQTNIDGTRAFVDVDGEPASTWGGSLSPDGRVFDAEVAVGHVGYELTMDGRVDRPMFDAFLASIKLSPADAVQLPYLSGTFTSPRYGYTIKTAGDWTTTAGTRAWSGTDDSPSGVVDQIVVTGTDTTISGTSQALPSGTSFDAWLAAEHRQSMNGVPTGCDGGDPSTWPAVSIGTAAGRLQQFCNAASAFVFVGGRVYEFDWGNSTFDAGAALTQGSWEELLSSVILDPSSAKH
jgi:hypothetical protein